MIWDPEIISLLPTQAPGTSCNAKTKKDLRINWKFYGSSWMSETFNTLSSLKLKEFRVFFGETCVSKFSDFFRRGVKKSLKQKPIVIFSGPSERERKFSVRWKFWPKKFGLCFGKEIVFFEKDLKLFLPSTPSKSWTWNFDLLNENKNSVLDEASLR